MEPCERPLRLSEPREPIAMIKSRLITAGLGQQRRPGRIGRHARGGYLELVAAGDVDSEQRRALAGIAEEHDHPPVRREGRPLVMEALGEDALARAVGLENADGESTAQLAGEGDVVAARRPYRRRVMSLAEADALRRAAAGRHHVDLLGAAAVALEADVAAVRRVARVGVIHISEPTRRTPISYAVFCLKKK